MAKSVVTRAAIRTTEANHRSRPTHSALAAVFVALLAFVAIRPTSESWWPLSAGAMFAFRAQESHTLSLDGTDATGDRFPVTADSFGLSDVELTSLVERAAGWRLGFDDLPLLGAIAQQWNDRHATSKLVALTLKLHRVLLRERFARLDETVLTWRADQ